LAASNAALDVEHSNPEGDSRKLRIARSILLRRVEQQLKFALLQHAGLNMTVSPEMRDLAQRLLTYEGDGGKNSGAKESSTLRVYEKLHESLSEFVGVAGFQLMASRALALARREAPSLSGAQVAADGSIEGLGEMETQFEIDSEQASEGGILLIAQLLGLLDIFLGEALTRGLLRKAWPGEVFEDRNSVHGGKA